MKKRFNFHLKTKHIFTLLAIICISLLIITFASDFSAAPLRTGAGYFVVPFEKGINTVGDWINSIAGNFKNTKELSKENDDLKEQISTLKEQNNQLVLSQKELERFRELYNVDESYANYSKVAAQVIAKDPGNWYSSFKIDKGTNEGIAVDMNVLASGGLAGIVTEVGPSWAIVQSVIDDDNNISGMTVSDSKTCVITGNLELMDRGNLAFSQLTDEEGSVTVGENIVTSHISNKYLKGILIGTISDISPDANNLTSSGYIVPAVDFKNIQEVLVITQLKEQEDDSDEE